MTPLHRVFVMIAVACAQAVWGADSKPDATPAAPDWLRFKIVVEHNIFSKDHSAAGSIQAADAGKAQEPKPETQWTLVGVVERDRQLLAFVENRSTQKTQTLKSGDAVASGKVGAITLDSMEYVAGTSTTIVNIGKNLSGGTAAPATTADAQRTAAPATPETNSVLEQMRRKRQEELRK